MIPSEEDVMLLLGHVVYEAQETESTLHIAFTFFYGLSVAESIEQLKKIYGKKTMGQFLILVRDKIGINQSFDDFMLDYIEQRNFIVHNLSRTTRFSLHTEDGRQKLSNFLTNFRYMNRKVKFTFMALVEVWMQKFDPAHQSDEKFKEFRYSDMFREIKDEFIPQLRPIFGNNSK
jgi:hypothetical protein